MKKILSIIVFLACMLNLLHSQSLIDINASGTRALQAEVSDNPIIREMFKEADRYRTFNYNKQLVNIRSHNVGDTLLLSFFDDKQYKAVIQSVSITDEGRTAIASQVEGSAFAYCYIIVSENTITISAETPFEDEYFFASVKGGAAYIGQMRKSEMDKNAIEGSGPLMPPPVLNKGESNFVTPTRGEADPATVDLLYVYTPAAELWAANNTGQTDIHDLITISLQKANTVMQNSGTGITYNIAYKHLTNYVEDDSSIDLDRITNTNDGYMDEVHDLRNAFYADVIVFIPEVTFTGGVAWLLSNENGFAQDNYAVALSRVQQSSWTYTVVHEVGHNMGCGHHAEQNVQPGPGLHSYSSGWRGTISGRKECTVMTYESGSYFDDGQAHVRIPYFSSPDLQVEGVTIGSATENNALTLKKTKTAVAAYRTPPTTPTLTVSHNSLSFTDMPTQTLVVSGFHLTGNISYVFSDPGSFSVNTSSWDAAKGGILNLTFIGSALLNYEGTLTVSGGGVPSKVVNLKYTVCSTPIISIEE
ncbi:MAG: zinc-dependent metalloprotease, partial [Lentimicrobiaceae bacterium]|nr:zinc-dependent metalloprotease [Lentimicrobiaceae bacterium]